MAEKKSFTSNGSSPAKRKRMAASELDGSFSVSQLDAAQLRKAIVSPDEDTDFFGRLSSRPDEALPMRESCRPVSAERTSSPMAGPRGANRETGRNTPMGTPR